MSALRAPRSSGKVRPARLTDLAALGELSRLCQSDGADTRSLAPKSRRAVGTTGRRSTYASRGTAASDGVDSRTIPESDNPLCEKSGTSTNV